MNKKKSFITSTLVTLLVVVMLILSGPAQAVLVTISGLQTTYKPGSYVNFTVSIEISDPDAFVPMSNISVDVTGPQNINTTFALDGTPKSSNSIISITPVSIPRPVDFGYGYGHGNDSRLGYGYNFGYGYGYGYGYGAGGGTLTYIYNVSINTTSLPTGNYMAIASLNTGKTNKPAFTSALSTFTITTLIGAPNITSFAPPTPVDNTSVPAIRTFNITVNQTVNVTWYFNGVVHKSDILVTESNHTMTTSLIGVHNVTAVASNINGADSQKWDWNVTTAAPYFAIGSVVVNENESGTVSLYLNNSNKTGSFDVNVTFNSSIANVTAIAKNPVVEHLVYNISTGMVRIGGFNLNTSLSGDVKLADVTLKAVGRPGSSTVLGITVNSLADENVTTDPKNVTGIGIQQGSFRIKDIVTVTFVSPLPVVQVNYVNVSILLNREATPTMYWEGVAESMVGSGTNWYKNKTNLLSGNYTYYVRATASDGVSGTSETRIVTIDVRNNYNLSLDAGGNVSTQINGTSPDGNVTFVIPVGTNATLNGVPINNISIASVRLTSDEQANLSSGKRFLGVNVDLKPDGAIFKPPIQVRFNYTNAMVAGIDEPSLEIRFYNTTSGAWESSGIVIISRDTAQNFVIANVSHFSTFAIVGSPSVTSGGGAGPSGDGGGGGVGGGGVVTSEPYDNIAKYETRSKALIANTPVTYTFTAPEHGIYELMVTGKENENDIAIRVEALKGTSKLVATSAPGTAYKNLNIWAGSKKIKEALVRFKVENTWITSNSFADSDVKMLKWDGTQWTQLETTQKTKDNTYTYFEAKTDTFSSFAISGVKGGVVAPTVTPSVTVTGTPTKTPVVTVTPPVKPSAIPTWVYALIIVVVIAAAVYFFVIRKKEEKK
ncbi:MAG: PGF-pre-PGF domain-containing protein [Euryarchaeota archaeon]|nr:PGF-pre-PGF domain-containing protein [Euryarchaeota archaeon]